MEHIDISDIVQDFHHHILMNRNVILSGSFGSGKSYMIDEFKRTYAEEFRTISIYPINYSISSNADIVEYIKHDIIFQLIQQGYITEQTDFSTISSSFFTTENVANVTKHLLSEVPGGGLIAGVIKASLEAKDKYDKDNHTASKYIDSFDKVGSIYERDIYTEMIRLGLEAGKRDGKQWILIIEDLDRIDPHNIFRLLNVFGAHLDCRYINGEDADTSNKFGFDKIVLVLDYRQTSEIYNKHYGLESFDSWEGYISKFLTSQPFYFYGVADRAKRVVMAHIAAECGMEEDVVNAIFSSNYSMRTLSKVSFANYPSFLRTDKIELTNGVSMLSDCKYTRLLFYIRQLNSGNGIIREIAEDFPEDYVSVLAPVLLYSNHVSRLCVEYSIPNRQSEYWLDSDDDNADDAYSVYRYMLSVTEDGECRVQQLSQEQSLSIADKVVEMVARDDFAVFCANELDDFCSKFTRY